MRRFLFVPVLLLTGTFVFAKGEAAEGMISKVTPKLGFRVKETFSKKRGERIFSMVQIELPGIPGCKWEVWCYEDRLGSGEGKLQPDGSLILKHHAYGKTVEVTTHLIPKPGEVEWVVTVDGTKKENVRKITSINPCWQHTKGDLFGNRGDFPHDFVPRCFIWRARGFTLFKDTMRFPDTRKPPDHRYNSPPWVQNYKPIWGRHRGQPRAFWGTSTDRPIYSMIGTVSRDGKYLTAFAWRKSNNLGQGWHDCLHISPDFRPDYDAKTGRTVSRGKMYFMKNDPLKLLTAYKKDFKPWCKSLAVRHPEGTVVLDVGSPGHSVKLSVAGNQTGTWRRTPWGTWSRSGTTRDIRWQIRARAFGNCVNLYVTVRNRTAGTLSAHTRAAWFVNSSYGAAKQKERTLTVEWEGDPDLTRVRTYAQQVECLRLIPDIPPKTTVTIRGRFYLFAAKQENLAKMIERDRAEWARAVPFLMALDEN